MIDAQIRPFKPADQDQVITLWQACGLTRPWNDPAKDIERKLTVQPELFLVAEEDGQIVGSVMGGYDGHRGNVYYLAVHPDHQKKDLGRALMERLESEFEKLGCPKTNLMIRTTNTDVQAFYKALGFESQEVIVLGKRIVSDD